MDIDAFNSIKEVVCQITGRKLNIEESDYITDHLDSLLFTAVILELEEKLNITIDDEELYELELEFFSDLNDFLKNKLNK